MPCAIHPCPNPPLGRAKADDMCLDHWNAWRAAPEYRDKRDRNAWFVWKLRALKVEAAIHEAATGERLPEPTVSAW